MSVPTHQPLLHVLVAACLGVAVDRFVIVPPLLWLAIFLISCIAWWVCFCTRRFRISSLLILGLAGTVAGVWHHLHWHRVSPIDIGLYATRASSPAVVRGTIFRQPKWVTEPQHKGMLDRRRGTRTRLVIRVREIRDGRTFRPTSGLAEVYVNGQISGLVSKDDVEVCGFIRRIQPPTNPGQFDFQRYFRGQSKYCWITVDHPDAIRGITSASRRLAATMGRLRTSLDYQIWKYVTPDCAPLASAMLLGNRQQLDEIQRQRFLISGTIHLLAISGLHVGILSSLFLMLPRLNLVSRKAALLLTVMFVLSYAWLVEFRPPVVRAAILITIFCYCKCIGRQPFSFNALATAGIVVLAINPADLFNAGAQLSFLAVASLMFAQPWLLPRRSPDPIDRLIENTRSPRERLWHRAKRAIRATALASGIIWLLAMPLVALQFHIVAPIALLVNPLLLLPVTTALFCGFGVLVFGWLIPPLGYLFGKGCGFSLWTIQTLVEFCEHIPLANFWTSGPSSAAVAVFYIMLFAILLGRPVRLSVTWLIGGILAWILCGWVWPTLIKSTVDDVEPQIVCTVIDVGHGNCVLLQIPSGENVLYDCGSFGSASQGLRNVAAVLWSERIGRIDAVVISHGDSDHFNALPELARRFAIGRVIISQPMANGSAGPVAEKMLDRLRTSGIPIEAIETGNRIAIANQVTMTALSPPADGFQAANNADSLVLAVTFGQFQMLLPGDLEGQALDLLLQGRRHRFDVAMAPHHGSSNSKPLEFVTWSQPKLVVISSAQDASKANYERLAEQHRFDLYHTGVDGAIRIDATRDGQFRVRCWLREPW